METEQRNHEACSGEQILGHDVHKLLLSKSLGGLISVGKHCVSVQSEIPNTQIPNLGGRCWSVTNKQKNYLQDVLSVLWMKRASFRISSLGQH